MKHRFVRAASLIPVVLAGALAAVVGSGEFALPRVALEIGVIGLAVLAAARATWLLDVATVRAEAVQTSDTQPTLLMSRSDRRSPIIDRVSGLYMDWYFRLRVEEEITRAERFGQRFSVVRLPTRDSTGADVARSISASLRDVDCAGDLGYAIAVLLPNTDGRGARIWREKRLNPAVDPSVIRISEYPTDGQTLSQLLGDDAWGTTGSHDLAA